MTAWAPAASGHSRAPKVKCGPPVERHGGHQRRQMKRFGKASRASLPRYCPDAGVAGPELPVGLRLPVPLVGPVEARGWTAEPFN
jgi:hypothetical protein